MIAGGNGNVTNTPFKTTDLENRDSMLNLLWRNSNIFYGQINPAVDRRFFFGPADGGFDLMPNDGPCGQIWTNSYVVPNKLVDVVELWSFPAATAAMLLTNYDGLDVLQWAIANGYVPNGSNYDALAPFYNGMYGNHEYTRVREAYNESARWEQNKVKINTGLLDPAKVSQRAAFASMVGSIATSVISTVTSIAFNIAGRGLGGKSPVSNEQFDAFGAFVSNALENTSSVYDLFDTDAFLSASSMENASDVYAYEEFDSRSAELSPDQDVLTTHVRIPASANFVPDTDYNVTSFSQDFVNQLKATAYTGPGDRRAYPYNSNWSIKGDGFGVDTTQTSVISSSGASPFIQYLGQGPGILFPTLSSIPAFISFRWKTKSQVRLVNAFGLTSMHSQYSKTDSAGNKVLEYASVRALTIPGGLVTVKKNGSFVQTNNYNVVTLSGKVYAILEAPSWSTADTILRQGN